MQDKKIDIMVAAGQQPLLALDVEVALDLRLADVWQAAFNADRQG